MRSRKPYLIFWPQYFDLKRSRSEGRRLPKKYALEKVTAQDIATVAKKLGYDIQYEGNYRYSKSWWDPPGRVLIDTKGKKKLRVLIEVAKELRILRSKK